MRSADPRTNMCTILDVGAYDRLRSRHDTTLHDAAQQQRQGREWNGTEPHVLQVKTRQKTLVLWPIGIRLLKWRLIGVSVMDSFVCAAACRPALGARTKTGQQHMSRCRRHSPSRRYGTSVRVLVRVETGLNNNNTSHLLHLQRPTVQVLNRDKKRYPSCDVK